MPPRSSLTGSFSVSDASNEVVCPLANNDGSNCRKRCLGEKRYRSMQEHIRRAHPDHYIPKLPATEESFQLMVNTPPDQRPHQPPPSSQNQPAPAHAHPRRDKEFFARDSPATPRTIDEAHPAAATAAVALAQLHHHRLNTDWDSEADAHSDSDVRRERMRSSIELPPLRDHFKQESIPPFQSPRPRELLPSILAHSPPGRSSTLPPIQRRDKPSRPRKGSLTQSARKGKHERQRSREYARRPSVNDRKALSAEPQTAAWVQGKRWEDLIEAATTATEVDDRDTTPIPQSPSFRSFASVTSAPSAVKHRSSVPPAFQSTPGSRPSQSSYRPFAPLSYNASPLQKALTPPPFEQQSRAGPDTDLEPFPSVESSMETNSITSSGGKNFHIPASGLPPSGGGPNSSPIQRPRPLTSSYPPSSHPHQLQNHHHHNHHQQHQQHPHDPQQRMHRFSNPGSFPRSNNGSSNTNNNPTTSSSNNNNNNNNSNSKDPDIYCASCSRPWPVRDAFACTECICGVCRECVGVITGLQTPGRSPASILNPTSSPGGNGNGNVGSGGRLGLPMRRSCPSCGITGGKWKAFQLEFR